MIYATDACRYVARVTRPAPVTFWFEGQPLPKQRPRHGANGHVFTPAKTRDYERAVAWVARSAMGAREPLTGDLVLTVTLYRKGKRRADVDNMLKALADSMNSIVYGDDQQIVEKRARVVYGASKPGAQVEVRAA